MIQVQNSAQNIPSTQRSHGGVWFQGPSVPPGGAQGDADTSQGAPRAGTRVPFVGTLNINHLLTPTAGFAARPAALPRTRAGQRAAQRATAPARPPGVSVASPAARAASAKKSHPAVLRLRATGRDSPEACLPLARYRRAEGPAFPQAQGLRLGSQPPAVRADWALRRLYSSTTDRVLRGPTVTGKLQCPQDWAITAQHGETKWPPCSRPRLHTGYAPRPDYNSQNALARRREPEPRSGSFDVALDPEPLPQREAS